MPKCQDILHLLLFPGQSISSLDELFYKVSRAAHRCIEERSQAILMLRVIPFKQRRSFICTNMTMVSLQKKVRSKLQLRDYARKPPLLLANPTVKQASILAVLILPIYIGLLLQHAFQPQFESRCLQPPLYLYSLPPEDCSQLVLFVQLVDMHMVGPVNKGHTAWGIYLRHCIL